MAVPPFAPPCDDCCRRFLRAIRRVRSGTAVRSDGCDGAVHRALHTFAAPPTLLCIRRSLEVIVSCADYRRMGSPASLIC
eukprot:scaffold220991_cov32-Tisochrysis_lutea.AAC.4